ncbi:MAG TPA: class I SAM-dependent methyltransferase [Desulfosalsimonadaceae bacterium]|nr:class I SAM-dependent methyltransferase [Desulfosalsimonadaceae bacterium]
MDESAVINSYKRLAGSYDKIFGRIFEHGRKQVVEKMGFQDQDRVLEVGIGTGLAMDHYPPNTSVYGIDISPHMLAVARRNMAQKGRQNIKLALMDAQRLCFPDNFFNKVSAMYVATVVPDPCLMMQEIKRVCAPGGDIFVLNHFSSPHVLPGLLESMLTPLQRIIGFRPRFSMQRFIADNCLEVVETEPVNLMGYWTLIHARNREAAASSS